MNSGYGLGLLCRWKVMNRAMCCSGQIIYLMVIEGTGRNNCMNIHDRGPSMEC